jgi:hypothetical protein
MRLPSLTPVAFAVVVSALLPLALARGYCSHPCDAVADTPEGSPAGEATPGETKDGLDIKQLTARLRATKAIGFFTKLALKNEIDDLLDKFREYHGRTREASLEALREHFNLLFIKVISLLQDEDLELFRTLAGARETLWNKLADPTAFAQL